MSCKKTNYETKKEVNSLWIGTAINEKQGKVLSDNVIEALNEDGGDDVKTIEDALLYLNEKAGTGGGGAPGKDGVSPTVAVSKTGKITTVTITDKDGAHTATINDGEDGTDGAKGDKGDDGVSPTISAVRVSNGVQLTITDKNGSHSAVINDGIGDGSTVATFADVPSDGKSYLRQNSIWVEGATKEELAEIGQKVGELDKVVEWNPIQYSYIGEYITTGLAIGSIVDLDTRRKTTGWNSAVVRCLEGDLVIIKGSGGSAPRLWAFIDSDNRLLQVANSGATTDGVRIMAPIGSALLIINDQSNSTSYIRRDIIVSRRNNNERKVGEFDGVEVYEEYPTVGTTDERPMLNKYNVGFIYFDTTIGSNVTWDGSEWVQMAVDKKLESVGVPADAKIVGDLLGHPFYDGEKEVIYDHIALCEDITTDLTISASIKKLYIDGRGYIINTLRLVGSYRPVCITNATIVRDTDVRNGSDYSDLDSVSEFIRCTFVGVSVIIRSNVRFIDCQFDNCTIEVDANLVHNNDYTKEGYSICRADVSFVGCTFKHGLRNLDNHEIIHCVWVGYKGQMTIDRCTFIQEDTWDSSQSNEQNADWIDGYSSNNISITNCTFYGNRMTEGTGVICIKSHSWKGTETPWTHWTSNDLLGEKSSVVISGNRFVCVPNGDSKTAQLIVAGGWVRSDDWKEQGEEACYYPRANISITNNQVYADFGDKEFSLLFAYVKDVKNVSIVGTQMFIKGTRSDKQYAKLVYYQPSVTTEDEQYPANVILSRNQMSSPNDNMNLQLVVKEKIIKGAIVSDNIICGKKWVYDGVLSCDYKGNPYPKDGYYPTLSTMDKVYLDAGMSIGRTIISGTTAIKLEPINDTERYFIYIKAHGSINDRATSFKVSSVGVGSNRKCLEVESSSVVNYVPKVIFGEDSCLYIQLSSDAYGGGVIVDIRTTIGLSLIGVPLVDIPDEKLITLAKSTQIAPTTSTLPTNPPNSVRGTMILHDESDSKYSPFDRQLAIWHGSYWIDALGRRLDFAVRGTTEERPSLPSKYASFQYFDTTLKRPIWWTGSDWVDATGADV